MRPTQLLIPQGEGRDTVQQGGIAARTLPVVTTIRRLPPVARLAAGYGAALALLLALAQFSLIASRVPLRIDLNGTTARFSMDGNTLSLPVPSQPTALQLVRPPNTEREFQMDGTDSANNMTEDPA